MKILTVLITTLMLGVSQAITMSPVLAQQSQPTLSQAWPDGGGGFTSLNWLRAEDGGSLYSKAVYTEVSQNTLRVYNTYVINPFGKNARCGGLGCDLGKGQLIATLNFEFRGSQFIVRDASGQATFLKGAQCRVTQSYLKVLECRTNRTPSSSISLPSIFQFSPGT